MSSILLKIINDIQYTKGRAPLAVLQSDMNLRTDLHFDSLDLAQLTVLIEDQCGVDIFESDIPATIADVIAKLPEQLS